MLSPKAELTSFFKVELYFCVCVGVLGGGGNVFFIHSSIDECLGCFHIFAIVITAALDMEVWIFLRY